MPSAELAPGSTMTSGGDAAAGGTPATTSPTVAPSSTLVERVRPVPRVVNPDIGTSRSVVSAPEVRIRTVVSTAAHDGRHAACGEGARARGTAVRPDWTPGRSDGLGDPQV